MASPSPRMASPAPTDAFGGSSGGGSGTVTSVDVAAAGYTSSGAITTSGTITLTEGAQSGNKVKASPADGSSGVPAYRAIVAADLPDTYQPLDADLTAIAALSTTSYGRGHLVEADAAAGRTYLGLGTLATQSGTFSGTSSGTNTGDQTITLTGDVTGSGTGSFAATIGANKVTYAKMQATSQACLLGSTAAGAVAEITIGSGLAFSGGALTASGGGGGMTTSGNNAASTAVSADWVPGVDATYKMGSVSKFWSQVWSGIVVFGSSSGAYSYWEVNGNRGRLLVNGGPYFNFEDGNAGPGIVMDSTNVYGKAYLAMLSTANRIDFGTVSNCLSLFNNSVEYDRYDRTTRRMLHSTKPGGFAAIGDTNPIARYGGNNKAVTTAVGNTADNTEDTLITYTLPASQLTATGDRLEITSFGTTAGNATVKTIRLYFGATVLCSITGAFNNADWCLRATVIRTGAATQVSIALEFGNLSLITQDATFTTPTETLSGTIVIKTTSQSTATGAANDVVNKGLLVDVFPVGA